MFNDEALHGQDYEHAEAPPAHRKTRIGREPIRLKALIRERHDGTR